MGQQENYSEIIRRLLEDIVKRPINALDLDAPLRRLGVDSTAMIQVILELEARFGIRIPDEDILPCHFHSIETLTRYIQKRV